jgi:hypothetical protein
LKRKNSIHPDWHVAAIVQGVMETTLDVDIRVTFEKRQSAAALH